MEDTKRYKLWSCQNASEALIYLLDNIYIRFGAKLYRQIVGIPMGTNCAPLVADLFLFCYERDIIVTKWIKSCLLQCFGTFKIPILMFISILVFRPEGQIWNPLRRDTRIYVQRILNASRISKTQLNSYTISPS